MEIKTETILDFEVVCNDCGDKLSAAVIGNEIVVDACETCLNEAKEDK